MGIVERLRLLEKRVVDLYNKLTKIENNSSGTGDYIPLTGTEVGSPVSGDILFQDSIKLNFDGDTQIIANEISLSAGDRVVVFAPPSSKGITGSQDFTANITDFDYVQKKYVDEQIAANSGTGKQFKAMIRTSADDGNITTFTILQNDLGLTGGTWTRLQEGIYTLTFSNASTVLTGTFYTLFGLSDFTDKRLISCRKVGNTIYVFSTFLSNGTYQDLIPGTNYSIYFENL